MGIKSLVYSGVQIFTTFYRGLSNPIFKVETEMYEFEKLILKFIRTFITYGLP